MNARLQDTTNNLIPMLWSIIRLGKKCFCSLFSSVFNPFLRFFSHRFRRGTVQCSITKNNNNIKIIVRLILVFIFFLFCFYDFFFSSAITSEETNAPRVVRGYRADIRK